MEIKAGIMLINKKNM